MFAKEIPALGLMHEGLGSGVGRGAVWLGVRGIWRPLPLGLVVVAPVTGAAPHGHTTTTTSTRAAISLPGSCLWQPTVTHEKPHEVWDLKWENFFFLFSLDIWKNANKVRIKEKDKRKKNLSRLAKIS